MLVFGAAPESAYTHPPTAHIQSRELVELSGIVPATAGREFWGHNDSGHPPVLFRFNDHGEVLQRVALSPAVNVDWEGMTIDAAGAIYVGDFGDNRRRRSDCTIYKVAEPAPDADKIAPAAARRFAYPDGKARDCEAIFAMGGRLYLISKEASPLTRPTVFCLNDFSIQAKPEGADGKNAVGPSADTIVLREVGRLQIGGLVTGAAYSPSRKELAVLTYSGVMFYAVEEEADLLRPAQGAIGGYFGQCEAICYDGNDVIITNEPGTIWRMSVRDR